jgi:hypothetical protein
MSTNGSANNVTAIELDMRHILQAKRTTLTAVGSENAPDYSSLVSGISVRSIEEIDHLIDGLQGLREKLQKDGARLHRQIEQHVSFSQSIVQLSEIISDGMASVSKAVPAPADAA